MPKGFPQHPGTSFLADAAPVVKNGKGMRTSTSRSKGGGANVDCGICYVNALGFHETQHISNDVLAARAPVHSASAVCFEEFLKTVKSMS